MKKISLLLFLSFSLTSVFAQIEGTWKLSSEAGALAVGPGLGDYSWWSIDATAIDTRACLFDDEYIFNDDGSFVNVQQDETWLEPFQGVEAEVCGTPVAPHNGTNTISWSYDEMAGTVNLLGVGGYLGLSKVINDAELTQPSDAAVSITYNISFSNSNNTMTLEIASVTTDGAPSAWRFILQRDGVVVEPPVADFEGTWKLAPEAGALAVGPELGDYSWWSIDATAVATRACLFDDEYIFNDDGSFVNVQQSETWLEPFQGVETEICGTPVAPHNGTNTISWSYDETAGTVNLLGVGGYLGLSKVINGAELTEPSGAAVSITYHVSFSDEGNTMTVEIESVTEEGIPSAWRFILKKGVVVEPPVVDFEGTWILAPEAGALAVGPSFGDYSWWSNDEAAVATRDCLFDDVFVFNEDGSFQNVQQGETWLEPFQGVEAEMCGTPVAPHDGSNAATWAYDDMTGAVTLTGMGAYLGLAKVVNGAELTMPADAPASVTYITTFSDGGNRMIVEIASVSGDGTPSVWRFTLIRGGSVPVVEIKEDLFSFYPNPAQSIIQINAVQQMDEYIIRDITGKIVLAKSATSLNETMDVSQLARGMYLLESRVDNQVSVKKLIVQ